MNGTAHEKENRQQLDRVGKVGADGEKTGNELDRDAGQEWHQIGCGGVPAVAGRFRWRRLSSEKGGAPRDEHQAERGPAKEHPSCFRVKCAQRHRRRPSASNRNQSDDPNDIAHPGHHDAHGDEEQRVGKPQLPVTGDQPEPQQDDHQPDPVETGTDRSDDDPKGARPDQHPARDAE